MNCETAQQNIVLASYGELADDATHGLERHLADCEECRKELAAMKALMEVMAFAPVLEPSPNLVAQSRMHLDEALDKLTPRERTVFELKHYQGLKLRTIGEMLSTTEETAKNTLFRATRKLRANLAGLRG